MCNTFLQSEAVERQRITAVNVHGLGDAEDEEQDLLQAWTRSSESSPDGTIPVRRTTEDGSKRRCVSVSSRPVIAPLLPSSSPSHSRRLHAAASVGGGNGAWVAFRSGEELHGWKKIEAQLARGQERLCQDH